ncbi:Peroxin/Dysferlin domain-containing protein, partial [Mycotypha africana]|uniref:Peroxin/Dysferlin domain-containing protein n=1 Tax=Mycotypha africana TaxID=64632 RepID=UPI00230034A7
SFTSPYKAQTIDQIPTPILKGIIVLGPIIRLAVQFLQILLWKTSNPRQSFLVVLVYICLCLWAQQVIMFGLPCIVIYKLGRDWICLRTNQRRRETLEKKRQQERMKRYQMLNEEMDDENDDRLQQLRKQQQKEEEEEMYISRKIYPVGQITLDDTIQDINTMNECIDEVKQHLLQQSWLTRYLEGTHTEMMISILTVWMYVTPIWVVLCWLWGTRVMMAAAGSLILVSPAPWFQLIVVVLKRNTVLRHILAALYAYGIACILTACQYLRISPFSTAYRKQQKKLNRNVKSNSSTNNSSSRRNEMVFHFEIFENQRWWLGVNWTTNMMPSEREPWTDNELKPIPAKEKFKLPESTVKSMKYVDVVTKKEIEKTVNKVWQWVDGDWWVDMTGELDNKVDQNGWEYGNNAWKQMSGTPGLQTFTRRRKWCRRAKL